MSEDKCVSTPTEVYNEWVKENPGVDSREGRGPEVAEIAEALDTRTDPDELGDLVDPWDEWMTDQIECLPILQASSKAKCASELDDSRGTNSVEPFQLSFPPWAAL